MKKTKLFLSLCMMCLCVAVLCMGILAASSATYNIKGNITYNTIDGIVLLNTRVYKVAGTTSEADLSTMCTTLSTKSFDEIERMSGPYFILSQNLGSQALLSTTQSSSSTTGNVSISYGAGDSNVSYLTYYVVIGVRNESSNLCHTVSATISNLTESSISNVKSNSSVSDIKKDNFQNIVIGFSYTGTTTTEGSFNYSLTVSYEVDWPLTLNCDSESQYWYVELGQASSSDTTKLRWRLISLDGSTKYTYSSTKPTYQSGAIFLQESTLLNGTSNMTQYYSTTADEDSNYNNWYNSTIRTYVNTPSNYGLTASDMSTYVKPRTITGIENYGSTEGTYRYTNASNNYSGTTTDNFWLLSSQEINKFLGSNNSSRKWQPYNYTSAVVWWSRSPYSGRTDSEFGVSTDGSFDFHYASYDSYGVRAAFQLA